jgi:hypothetical protein
MTNEFIVALANLRKAALSQMPPHSQAHGDPDVLIVQHLTVPGNPMHADGLAGPQTLAKAIEWIETKWAARDPMGAPAPRRMKRG